MNIIVEKSCESVDREKWNSIVSLNATQTVFQTWEWHRAFETTYSSEYSGYILCGMEGSELTGIAPLCICRIRKETIIRFLGYERADYCDFIYLQGKPEFVTDVFSFLNKNRREWDRLELYNIPEQSPTFNLVSEACASFHLYSRKSEPVPCPALLFKDKDRPCEEMLGKKSLVRHHKYFSKKQDYRVSHFVHEEKIVERLPGFFEQHIARWSVTVFPSLFLTPVHQQFYLNLVRELEGSGWMLFTEVCSDAHPIAFHFGFVYHGRLIWYKPSFDILLSSHSPGEALLKELMIFAEENGLDELDFTRGDEPFKRRFSNIVRYNGSFDVFNHPARYVSYSTRHLIKESLERLPVGFKRTVLSAIEKIREHGIRDLPRKTASNLMSLLFRSSDVIVFSRIEKDRKGIEKESRELYQVRRGTLEDLIRFSEDLPVEKRHEIISDAVRRFGDDGTLFVAEKDCAIAGIAWTFEKESVVISEVAYRMKMAPDSIVIMACMTAPRFRRKHVFLTLLQAISGRFPEKMKVIYCDEKNIPSLRGIEKVFEGDKVIRMISIFGIRFHSVQPIRKELTEKKEP